jgi:hypothetical protein
MAAARIQPEHTDAERCVCHRIQEIRVEETTGYNPTFYTSLDPEFYYSKSMARQALRPATMKAAIIKRRISLPTVDPSALRLQRMRE